MQESSTIHNTDCKFPLVAIVILNWNGRSYLEKFLPSVVASGYPNFKIVVGDNASADESVSFVIENYPQIQIIKNDINEGFARGYNLVLAQVKADYYVLLNSDVEVTAGWLQPIISLMENDKMIVACQPKILQDGRRESFEYAGASGGWIDKLGYPFARGRVFDICETDKGQYDNAVPCFWASGAALVVRADLYQSIGGLDEFFFAHQEEIDLCWRLQNAGYKIYVQPASIVYHVGGGTLPKSSRKTYLNFRNNLILLHKNLKGFQRFSILFFRFFLDMIAAVKELLSGNAKGFIAIIKAWGHFLRWIFVGKKERDLLKNNFLKLPGVYHGSVIWAYYVKGKKTFFEIVKR